VRLIATEIPAVIVIEPQVWADNRGFFMEIWNRRRFVEAGIDVDFVQDNYSHSVRGTLRGLHYQVSSPQGKLVRATAGEIFDVVVDLRRGSPTFGRWVGRHISAQNRLMLWVPPSFAHGFYVLSEFAECLYKCTDYYAPELERVLAWDDRQIGVEWPLVNGKTPLLSERDARGVPLSDAELFE
jgi:dTDP-4-dehydrorhamnose 3,5-epimerase